MPIVHVNSSGLTPDYTANPDIRFATTFLSNEYREYGVNGESLMDKATGEIFTKRNVDGRVVSFFQNKKYIGEMLQEFVILTNNNPSFTFPEETDLNSLYLSTDYDLMTINDDHIVDIVENNISIPNTNDTMRHQLKFNLSGKTNGFFIRLTTRDSDKNIVNWLVLEYNNNFKDYAGTNEKFLAEARKFNTIEKWQDSSATIFFNVVCTQGEKSVSYSAKDYIRVNEDSCVLLPLEAIEKDFPNGYDSARVEISSFEFEKIHFMLTNKTEIGADFANQIQKFILADNKILATYASIFHFVNNSDSVTLLGNEFIVGLLDIPYMYRYLSKMAKVKTPSEIILSVNRPNPIAWGANGVWAERVRDVYKGGEVVERESEVNLKAMEDYFAKNTNITHLNITTEAYQTENMLLTENAKDFYTDAEVDKKMEELYQYVEEKTKSIVADNLMDVNEQGLLMDTVRTTTDDDTSE